MALSELQRQYFDDFLRQVRAGARIALIEVKNRESGKMVAMICGLNMQDGEPTGQAYPLAVLLTDDDCLTYENPFEEEEVH